MCVKVIATKCYWTSFVSFSKPAKRSDPKCSTSVLNTLVLILSPPMYFQPSVLYGYDI